jgi:hypothetical protein
VRGVRVSVVLLYVSDFVSDFSRVYTRGMPGPSYSWSSFSNSAEDASARLLPPFPSSPSAPQVLPLVLERLDESLVLMCDYLGWSLADAGMPHT